MTLAFCQAKQELSPLQTCCVRALLSEQGKNDLTASFPFPAGSLPGSSATSPGSPLGSLIFVSGRSQMNLSSLELTDSAVYLCASSQDTALHDQVPLIQKHSCPSSGSGCRALTASQQDTAAGRVDSLSQTFFPDMF